MRIYLGMRFNSFWSDERYPLTLGSQGSINLPNDATQLCLLCNKPTLQYWAHPALLRDSFQGFYFACIYTEWFRFHNNLPNLDFGHFFASPERILSTGPKSIAVILTAHKYSMQPDDFDSRQHCSWRGGPGCWSALAGSIIL